MKRFMGLILASFLVATMGQASHAKAEPEELLDDSLDGQCVVLRPTVKDPRYAQYVAKESTTKFRLVDDMAQAEPIRLEATDLGHYRMLDADGAPLFLTVFNRVWAGEKFGDRADWSIYSTKGGYRIAAKNYPFSLGFEYGILRSGDDRFDLLPATGCADAPEGQVNMLSEPTAPNVRADGSIVGIIDGHAHPVSSWAFGENFICGVPFAPGGIEDALAGCSSHQYGNAAFFDSVISGAPYMGEQSGWPTFDNWPRNNKMLHQQAYYTGIERAWRAGMRQMNVYLVGNKVICELYLGRSSSCDEAEQIRLQAQKIHEMQDYIDAQNGGAGRGWFRIVTTPDEAYDVAASGKLAVSLGVENSELLGCGEWKGKPTCTQDDIRRGLDELQSYGVSSVHPVHKFDNGFGGTRFDGGASGVVMNIGNYLNTGHWWTATSCEGASDNSQEITSDEIIEFYRKLTGKTYDDALPMYPSGKICNTRGLTPMGEFLIEELMSRHMLINIDHMSVKTARDTLDIVEESGYPGVTSQHTWSDREIAMRILADGGFLSGYSYAATEADVPEPSFLDEWRANDEAAGGLSYYAYGSDVNGLGPLPFPRISAAHSPLEYPFTAPNGATFDRQVTGEKSWDINSEGVANYGMYADWYADIVQQAGDDGPRLADQMLRGAQGYIDVWRATQAWTDPR